MPKVREPEMASNDSEQDAAYVEAGQRLRELRQSKDLSQEAVCITANVDQSSFSKAERQGLNQLSLKKLEAVAEAMDCVLEIGFRPRKAPSPSASRASALR